MIPRDINGSPVTLDDLHSLKSVRVGSKFIVCRRNPDKQYSVVTVIWVRPTQIKTSDQNRWMRNSFKCVGHNWGVTLHPYNKSIVKSLVIAEEHYRLLAELKNVPIDQLSTHTLKRMLAVANNAPYK